MDWQIRATASWRGRPGSARYWSEKQGTSLGPDGEWLYCNPSGGGGALGSGGGARTDRRCWRALGGVYQKRIAGHDGLGIDRYLLTGAGDYAFCIIWLQLRLSADQNGVGGCR
jgi:hypothetical protein